MGTKRVKLGGFIEIPDGVDVELGDTATFKGKGEVTGISDTLTHKDSGETTITQTITLTADAAETNLGRFAERTGPLDEAIAEEPVPITPIQPDEPE